MMNINENRSQVLATTRSTDKQAAALPPSKGGAEERGGGFISSNTNTNKQGGGFISTPFQTPFTALAPLLRPFLMLLFLFPLFSSGQTALEIIKKADELTRGASSEGEMTIKIVRPKWEREMKMKTWSLGTDYSMMLITAPAKEQGTVMLKRQKEVWNWVPSIERTVKLPPSMMMQSWMGTDLTNDDLVRQSSVVIDYTHQIVKDSTIDGRLCWKLKLTAKPDAPVVWGHIMVWVDKQYYIQLRTEFYDEDGFLVNIFNAYDVKQMGGRTMATRMEMIPVDKPGNKTILITNAIKFDTGVKEDFFNTNQMKKMK